MTAVQPRKDSMMVNLELNNRSSVDSVGEPRVMA
jgi:hypothetical protein